jgi:succinoglycan biosynthesis transport protein ExoP
MSEPAGEIEQRASSPEDYDDGIDLAKVARSLWRWRWLIAGATVLCGAVTVVMRLQSPAMYEAAVRMVVSPPTTAETAAPPAITVVAFRAMVENQSLAAQVITELRLDQPPLRLTAQGFLADVLTVETPRDTNIVVVRVRLASRELAAKAANRLAALAADLAERLNQDQAARTWESVQAQVDQARLRLGAAETKLGAFKQRAQIEVLRQDVQSELEARAGLLSLSVDIESSRARLRKAEEELGRRQAIGTVRRTIDNDPALIEAAKETTRPGGSVLGLEVKNEYPSKVYEELDQQVAESRATLSGLERRRAELIDHLKLGSAKLAKLNVLYEREAELAQLQTEHDLARDTFLAVATRFERVRLQGAGRNAQLQVLDAARPPDGPVGPRVRRDTAVAMLAGFALSVLAALFLSALVPER